MPNQHPAPHVPDSPARIHRRRVWTEAEIRQLGVTTDLRTAAAILSIGETKAYQLAKSNKFPVPLIRPGGRYVVPVQPILALLGYAPAAGGAA